MAMSIDDKIQQTKFRSEYHRLLANLTYNYLRIHSEQQYVLKTFKVTFQQFNVLSILRGQSPHPANLLLVKERMVDRSSDVSRIIERLVKKRLVHRSTCSQDRRQVDLVITGEGLDLLAAIDRQYDKFEQSVSRLSLEEARLLNALLDKLEK